MGPPDDEDLVRRLRDEVRAEAEEVERLAATASARSRAIGDVVADLRGDTVRVVLRGRSFTGVVVAGGRDYVTLEAPGGTVDLLLAGAFTLQLVEQGDPPPELPPTAPTFRARLLEHELAQAHVEVGDGAEEPVRGRLRAVAVDHLVVRDVDGADRYVGLEGVSYIVSHRAR